MAGLRPCGLPRFATAVLFAAVSLYSHAGAAPDGAIPVPEPIDVPIGADIDSAAMWLAMQCAEGGENARPALVAALDRMGWSVKDFDGNIRRSPKLANPTGLALRDYEIESLFWNFEEQPGLRLISYSRALAFALEAPDAEQLAQSIVDSIRDAAESPEPRRRFWARFIVALGVAQSGDDLTGPGEPFLLPVDTSSMEAMLPTQIEGIPEGLENASDAEKISQGMAIAQRMLKGLDIGAIREASTPKTTWPLDDPVLGRTPPPETGAKSAEEQMDKLQSELAELTTGMASTDPATMKKSRERYSQLSGQMMALNEAIQVANANRMLKENDPDDEGDGIDDDAGTRLMAEHRSTPLSILQIALITKVIMADYLASPSTDSKTAWDGGRMATASLFPPLHLLLAQAPTSLSGQLSASGADIWANASSTYTNAILDANLPDSSFSKKVGRANAISGWLKTLSMLALNKITLDVENAPLIRTKKRDAPGQKRRVRCEVEIDLPKGAEAMKVLRPLMNIATVDVSIPEGGPVSGAKVVWRLPEGGEATRYESASGAKLMNPKLAYVQFPAGAAGTAQNSSYVSFTDDNGIAYITVEGKPQQTNLPDNVRKRKRRATIAVEVTMKVGSLLGDLNDAFGAVGLKGEPGLLGVAGIISEMIQRSSLFFQRGEYFEVIDWAKPAWEGDVTISITGAGSAVDQDQKGGPPASFDWSMNRAMVAHVQTPEWQQEQAVERGADSSNRIFLEVAPAKRKYEVHDRSHLSAGPVRGFFRADGPVRLPPSGPGSIGYDSLSQPSGTATLTVWPETSPAQYSFHMSPTFSSKAVIFSYEQNGSRSNSETGVRDYDLLSGLSDVDDMFDNGTYDPSSGTITGTKRINAKGNLPYVPTFDVTIEFAYTLKYQEPPPSQGAP